jgi:signal transduction histidine kinase
MAAGWSRRTWRRWSGPRARDVVVVLLCALNTVLQAFGLWTRVGGVLAVSCIALGAIATVAMWWRRRFPVTVLAIAAITCLASQVLAPVLFGLLTVAIRRRDRVLVACTAGVAVCLVAPTPTTETSFEWPSVVAGAVVAVVFALWGAYVGARRDLMASLRDRAVRAEAERELRAEQARLAERARIAREMHDVLAHKVSLIALQAGALEVNPGLGAEQVEKSARLIRSTAREALEELREVLGVLRADRSATATGPGQLSPQPGLTDIPALVESSRSAGLRVTLSMPPGEQIDQLSISPSAISPSAKSSSAISSSIGRTAYRVVQESLTNVHKHARGAAAEVVISRAVISGDVIPRDVTDGPGSVLLVTVSNLRPVAAGSLLPGSGAGLIGLRERVALQGGSMTAGPTASGGWRVDARLPAGSVALHGIPDDKPDTTRDAAWLAS